jgi:hypothetical protein
VLSAPPFDIINSADDQNAKTNLFRRDKKGDVLFKRSPGQLEAGIDSIADQNAKTNLFRRDKFLFKRSPAQNAQIEGGNTLSRRDDKDIIYKRSPAQLDVGNTLNRRDHRNDVVFKLY